jgi:hypothetical protein
MMAAATFTMNDFDKSEARRIAEDLIGKYGVDAIDRPRPCRARGRYRRRYRASDLAPGSLGDRRIAAALTLS